MSFMVMTIICPIASALEDGQVHDMYGMLYSDLFDLHPSIRKMVQSVLKSDLEVVESHSC